MNAIQALKQGINDSDMVSLGYLQDLTDQELLHRPCAGCNHINWQVGHLIKAEQEIMSKAVPDSMPELPAGFGEKYTAATAASDDSKSFATKDELLRLQKQIRGATLAALERTSEDKLDAPSGVDFAPTVAAAFSMQGTHWLMHAGQWAIIRRQLGRKPLF